MADDSFSWTSLAVNTDLTKRNKSVRRDKLVGGLASIYDVCQPDLFTITELSPKEQVESLAEQRDLLSLTDTLIGQEKISLLYDPEKWELARDANGEMTSIVSAVGKYHAFCLELKNTSKRLFYVGVHLPTRKYKNKRAAAFGQVAKVVEDYKDDVDAVYIAGDWNTLPNQLHTVLPDENLTVAFDGTMKSAQSGMIDNFVLVDDWKNPFSRTQVHETVEHFTHKPISAKISLQL